MLTENQRSVIDSLTQEFLSLNERKVTSKPYHFFNTSPLDFDNELSREEIDEAKIINRGIRTQLIELIKSEYALLKEDLKAIPTTLHLCAWTAPDWSGFLTESDPTLAILWIGDESRMGRRIRIDYTANGCITTAPNGTKYVTLNGAFKVRCKEYLDGDIVCYTLADLFTNRRFVEKITRLYREYTK